MQEKKKNMKTDRRRGELLPPNADGNARKGKKNAASEINKNGRASRKSQQRLSSSSSVFLSLAVVSAGSERSRHGWQLARPVFRAATRLACGGRAIAVPAGGRAKKARVVFVGDCVR